MSVRCSWCYKRGHNRRSCPDLKKYIRENPDSYYARKEQQSREKAKNKSPRKCSYCREVGHTKRTCSSLAKDRQYQADKSRKWRTKFLSIARAAGFAPGALLKFRDIEDIKSGSWIKRRLENTMSKHGQYAMVTDLLWHHLDHRQESRGQAVMIVAFPTGARLSFMLPVEFVSLLDEYAAPQFMIAAKVDAGKIGETRPHDWHSGYDTADWHLPNLT